MKTTIIIGVFLCVAVVVLSRRPDPALKPYPLVFTAVYNESDLAADWLAPRLRTVNLDVPNKRASVSYQSQIGNTETWKLIYQPKGGDPRSPASQGYTGFNINPDFPANVPNNCLYTTGSIMSLAPFPPHWDDYGYPYQQVVDAWYILPNYLVYAGEYFIAELGVMSDRWDTVSQCMLQQSGIGQVPCASVMYSQGQNPLPLMDIRAFGAPRGSFQTDSYAIRVYHSLITSVQDSDFALPNNWEVTCGNADNGFVNDPDTGLMFYNNGESEYTFSLKLTMPPLASLGDVKVYLTPSPAWDYPCVDCMSFGVDHLTFTLDNWNVSQPWPMKYARAGCSQYLMGAHGGGYDWTYTSRTITTYTCVGSKSGGCVTIPQCDTSSLLN